MDATPQLEPERREDDRGAEEALLPGSAGLREALRVSDQLPAGRLLPRETSDLLHFFRAWTGNPRRVAAIAPSSRSLAALITREISAETGPVLELGPGTGVFTRALLARGVSERDLTLVECGEEFADLLHARFPAARVVRMDAARLAQPGHFEGQRLMGAVVSGLPLLAFSPKQVMAILSGAFARMREGGAFFQFTYTPRCPIPRRILERLGLEAEFSGVALLNVPPAAVFRVSRRASSALSCAA